MLGLPAYTQTNSQEENRKIMSQMQSMQDALFMAPVIPLPEVNYDVNVVDETTGMERYTSTKNGTPLFKKIRIKVQNYYRVKAHEQDLKDQQREQEELKRLQEEEEKELSKELSIEELTERNLKKIYASDDEPSSKQEIESQSNKEKKSLFSLFKKKSKDSVKSEDKQPQDEQNNTQAEKNNDTIELTGNVQTLQTPKDAQLDCENVRYFEEKNEVEATGNPVLYFPPQEVTLKADKIVYNTVSNIIKAYGNVEIIKQGESIFGDYIQINMNEETTLLTNMTAERMNMKIRAKKSTSADNTIILEDGDMKAAHSYIARFKTRILGMNFNNMVISDEDRSRLDPNGEGKINLDANEIEVDAQKNHNIITVKRGDLSYNDRHILDFKSLKIYADKKGDYFEANYPEFGTRSRIGAFIGPGFVFKTPFASTVKVIPFLNYKSGIGVGGAIKYKSATNYTELMYGSAENIFVARGKQQLDDKLYVQYGINSYMDDWFMGNRMAKYGVELVYNDGKRFKNFLAPNRDLTFKNRFSMGYMEDNDEAKYESENMTPSGLGTTRFKYMTEINQNLFKFGNEEELKFISLDLSMQGSVALYGTGDTQILGRIGPRLHTQYKYWMQDLGYYASAYQDDSPMQMFDAYRYGHSNLYIREALRVCKYLTVAYATSINLTDDSPNGKQWQENAFIIAVGPDDFKVSLGYDFMRQNTYFGINVAIDTKNANLTYDKMVIKNPDRLASNEKEVKEITFEEQKPKEKVKRTYAEVIEIEDPDREQL